MFYESYTSKNQPLIKPQYVNTNEHETVLQNNFVSYISVWTVTM